MTEKQGGSDVRANTTRAEPRATAHYEITGHKWFCSYPPCDVFLVLAQAPGRAVLLPVRGPRPRLPDPAPEGQARHALAALVGGGVPAACAAGWSARRAAGCATIIRMVNHTRLDCLLGSPPAMRGAVAEAVHHARHRSAFGKLLAEQPAMQNVLADLAIESEAATVDRVPRGARLRRGTTPPSGAWPRR